MAHDRLAPVGNLRCINSETKRQLKPVFRRCASQLASFDLVYQMSVVIAFFALTVLYIAIILFLPLLSNAVLGVQLTTIAWIPTYAVYVVITAVVFAVPFSVAFLGSDPSNRQVLGLLGISVILLVAAAFEASSNTQLRSVPVVSVSLVSALIAAPTGLLLLAVLIVASAFFRGLEAKFHPRAAALDALLSVLTSFEESGNQWLSSHATRLNLVRLEQAAVTLERYLPPSSQSGDLANDRWLRTEASRIAAHIRRQKRPLLMASIDQRSSVLEGLASTACSIASGNWTQIESSADEELREPRWRRFLTALWRIVAGFIPLIAFLGLQTSHFAVGGTLAGTLGGAVALWAILSVAALDPLFGVKMDAILRITPGGKPGRP